MTDGIIEELTVPNWLLCAPQSSAIIWRDGLNRKAKGDEGISGKTRRWI